MNKLRLLLLKVFNRKQEKVYDLHPNNCKEDGFWYNHDNPEYMKLLEEIDKAVDGSFKRKTTGS